MVTYCDIDFNLIFQTQQAQSQTPSAESGNILAFKPDGRLISYDEAENTSKKILVRKTLLPKKNVMVVTVSYDLLSDLLILLWVHFRLSLFCISNPSINL